MELKTVSEYRQEAKFCRKKFANSASLYRQLWHDMAMRWDKRADERSIRVIPLEPLSQWSDHQLRAFR
jgi:hypothetical protein